MPRKTAQERKVDQLRKLLTELPSPLMGASEVAEALVVSQTNLHHLKDLPEPVLEGENGIRASRVWLSADILAYADVYNARRGRRGRKPAQAAA